MNMKIFKILLLGIIILFSLCACDTRVNEKNEYTLEIDNGGFYEFEIGDEFKLSARLVSVDEYINVEAAFESSDSNIASVTENGNFKALSEGYVEIYASTYYEGKNYTAREEFYIYKPEADLISHEYEIELAASSNVVKVDEKFYIDVKLIDLYLNEEVDNSNYTVNFSVPNDFGHAVDLHEDNSFVCRLGGNLTITVSCLVYDAIKVENTITISVIDDPADHDYTLFLVANYQRDIYVGETKKLEIYMYDHKTYEEIPVVPNFHMDDSSILEIDENGNMKGIKEGVVNITFDMTFYGKEYQGGIGLFDREYTFTVTVYENSLASDGLVYLSTGSDYYYISDYTGTDSILYIPDYYNYKPVEIGFDLFKDNKQIKEVHFGKLTDAIGFSGASNLEKVTFKEGYSGSILYDAFSGCTSLNDIILPEGLTAIKDRAFYGCTSLQSVEVPTSVLSIGREAFRGCSELESFVFKDGSNLETLERGIFDVCDKLSSVVIPDSIISSNDCLKSGDTDFIVYYESISLPTNYIKYDNGFNNYIEVLGYLNKSFSDDQYEYAISQDSLGNMYANILFEKGQKGDIVIPSSINVDGIDIPVKKICDYLFYNNMDITSVYIQNSIEYINSSAFAQCKNITNLTFEDKSNLLEIGANAFYFCNLSKLELPNKIISIGENAFCLNRFDEIIIPASVKFLYESSFNDIYIFTEHTALPTTWDFRYTYGIYFGYIGSYESDMFSYKLFNDASDNKTIIIDKYIGSETFVGIPDYIDNVPVTLVQNNAFNGFDIDEFYIPKNITIHKYSLKNLNNNSYIYLGTTDRIDIEEGILYQGAVSYGISDDGFKYIEMINDMGHYIMLVGYTGVDIKINIPNVLNINDNDIPVTYIRRSAFKFENTVTVILPSTIQVIEDYGFNTHYYDSNIFCEHLTEPFTFSHVWNNRLDEYFGYIKSDSNEELEYALFKNENEEYEVTILNYLGSDTIYKIPDTINVDGINVKVTRIINNAFDNKGLEEITIPTSVIQIEEDAFKNNNSLILYLEHKYIPKFESGWSRGVSKVYYLFVTKGTTESGIYYEIYYDDLNNKYAKILGYTGNTKELVIPSVILYSGEEIEVKELNTYDFINNNDLKSIEIPSTIENNYFYYFINAKGLVIYDNHVDISRNDCETPVLNSFLTYGILDNGLMYAVLLDDQDNKYVAITGYCGKDTDILIPSDLIIDDETISVTRIYEYAFSYESTIATIRIPASITLINYWSFYECDLQIYFANHDFVNSVYDWICFEGNYIFNNLSVDGFTDNGLAYNFYYDENNTRYAEIVGYVGNEEEIVIPKYIQNGYIQVPITSIASYSFVNLNNKKIVIPDSISKINSSAIYKTEEEIIVLCESLYEKNGWSHTTSQPDWYDTYTKIVIVYGYAGINDIRVDDIGYAICKDAEGNLYTTITGYCGDDTNLIIPSTNYAYNDSPILKIATKAFYESNIKSISLPDSLIEIGYYAFASSALDESIIIPKSVKIIRNYAFNNKNLTIYCEVETKPSGYMKYWCLNEENVIYGYIA